MCHIEYDIETHQDSGDVTFDVCVECHNDENLGRSHSVGPGVLDPNTGGTMTCTSSCHFPHGSDNKFHLSFRDKADLCRSCHAEF